MVLAGAPAALLVVQSAHQVSLLDPLSGVLKPLASFGPDWTNDSGSTGLGCNSTHCISIGSWAMSPHCIGIFEKADPNRIRAMPLVGTTADGFSAPAFVESAQEWQVLDTSGTLHRIDDALSLHKIATASPPFSPPYFYHAAPVPNSADGSAMWCALSSASEPKGQVEGCFSALDMAAVSSNPAGAGGYATNIAGCGFSAALGRLVCAGYNGTQYGLVGFDASKPSMPSALLGVDPRTAGWKYGFSVGKLAVLGDGTFVMLAQPNLGVQRSAQLFVTIWDPATQELSAVNTTVQPALNDGNLAWALF